MEGIKRSILSVFCAIVMILTGFAVVLPINVDASDFDEDGLSDWDEINIYGSDETEPNTDYLEDDIPDGNLDFDTSTVWICDQEPNTILETVPLSRSEITSSGEAMQNPLLVYQNDREKENIEFMEQLTYAPQEINMMETVPQLIDQNQPFTNARYGPVEDQLVAQSFIPERETISSVDLFLYRLGDPVNDVTVQIQGDCEGFPDGIPQTTITLSLLQILDPGAGCVNIDFPEDPEDITLTIGATYWIVIDLGFIYEDQSNYYNIDGSTDDVYPNGKFAMTAYGQWTYWEPMQDLGFRTYYLHYPQFVDQCQIDQNRYPYHVNFMAQSFVSTHALLPAVELYMSYSGNPSHDVTVEIRTDAGGDPSTTILTSTSLLLTEILNPDQGDWIYFDFPDISIFPGTTYWIVVDLGSFGPDVNWLWYSRNNPYPYGQLKATSSGIYWGTLDPSYDICFKTTFLHNRQVPDQIQELGDYMGPIDPTYAQSFIPENDRLSSVDLCLYQWGSPPDDFVKVEIQEDINGYPSDNTLTFASYMSLGDILGSEYPTWINFDFPDIDVTPGNYYWIVLNSGPGQDPSNYNGFVRRYTDAYPGRLIYRSGNNNWLETIGDMNFRTNYPYNTPTGEISINFLHKIETEMGITPILHPIDEYQLSKWTEDEYGPISIVVANQELFMPYASTYAHRTYSAFMNAYDKVLCFFKMSEELPSPIIPTITYFGDDPVMASKLSNLASANSLSFQTVPTITDSEIALTPPVLPYLPTQQIHTHSAVTVIHSSDNSELQSDQQYWKIAPIYCAMRQTMLITVAGVSVNEIDNSLTYEIENNIIPNNNDQIPEYLIISSHWEVMFIETELNWNEYWKELTFKIYSPGGLEISQDSTGTSNYCSPSIAQSFYPDFDTLSSVELMIKKVSGCLDDFTIHICSDNEGEPGSILGSSTILNIDIPDNWEWRIFNFESGVPLDTGKYYWIVIEENDHQIIIYWENGEIYPDGIFKKEEKVSNVAVDYIYADLAPQHSYLSIDMAVGRINSYSITTSVLLINRGSLFDNGKMIEAWKACVVKQFLPGHTGDIQQLKILYGEDNVYSWSSAVDPKGGEKYHYEKELINQLKLSEFTHLRAHANQIGMDLTPNGLVGLEIIRGGKYPPSFWLLSGCKTGGLITGCSGTLIEGTTRTGAVNVICDLGFGAFETLHIVLSYINNGYSIGSSHRLTILSQNCYGSSGNFIYYLLGDPIVHYGRNADGDSDGLSDKDEAGIGTNPSDPDHDNDKLSDGMEVIFYGTDPLNSDSDGDYLSDGQEFDTDNDGLTDGNENHYHQTDPLNWDTDDDYLSDGLEISSGADPFDVDFDNDGLFDREEVYNNLALFRSGERSPTGEVFTRGVDRYMNTYWKTGVLETIDYYIIDLKRSMDIDKVSIYFNKFPVSYNLYISPDGTDWELIYSGEESTVSFDYEDALKVKITADDVKFLRELEVYGSAFASSGGTYPYNPDTDGDGFYDGGEKTSGTDANDDTSIPIDSDSDYMDDAWETEYFGDLSHDADIDDDGDDWTNIKEYWYQTDPTNPGDKPGI